MHTQEEHVKAMNTLGLGWMLILKDNQPSLYAAADSHHWQDEPVLHGTSQTGHGRHEIRTIRVISDIPGAITAKLPGTAQMMLIERYRHDLPPGGAPAACTAGDPGDHDPLACAAACGTRLSCETVLAVTALTPAQAGPAFLLTRDRGHWAIENSLHYRRDVSLGEDASGLAPANPPGCSPPSAARSPASSTGQDTQTTPPHAATSAGTAPACKLSPSSASDTAKRDQTATYDR